VNSSWLRLGLLISSTKRWENLKLGSVFTTIIVHQLESFIKARIGNRGMV
jgi:hypothetical protein